MTLTHTKILYSLLVLLWQGLAGGRGPVLHGEGAVHPGHGRGGAGAQPGPPVHVRGAGVLPALVARAGLRGARRRQAARARGPPGPVGQRRLEHARRGHAALHRHGGPDGVRPPAAHGRVRREPAHRLADRPVRPLGHAGLAAVAGRGLRRALLRAHRLPGLRQPQEEQGPGVHLAPEQVARQGVAGLHGRDHRYVLPSRKIRVWRYPK
ncbi:hypothetical protein ON010_g18806 [Phytophthora cinnamomi]|nr:hypothetical protein ON010_g18806 [Phytophthora cinnamomi]